MTLDSHVLEALDDSGFSLGIPLPPIGDQQIAWAIRLIDTSGICARIAEWRAEDRRRAGRKSTRFE